MSLPIEPYLIELLLGLANEGIEPIIAGGLGIYLKHRWVVEELEAGRPSTLLAAIPDARATDDIDAFLRLEVFVAPKRAGFRRVLSKLGYEPRVDYLLFEKPLPGAPGRSIKLDVLAPLFEDPRIKVDAAAKPGKLRRTGARDNRSAPERERLHGFATPEAFAVWERAQGLPLRGRAADGSDFHGRVLVPHPFAALCMKIQAAADDARALPADRKDRGDKHAQDVYRLVAMLSEAEVEECEALREHFRDHPMLPVIGDAAVGLFSTPESPGCVTIARTIRDAELDRFASVVTELFARR